MKVVFFTRDYLPLAGGHNTWLCHFLPALRAKLKGGDCHGLESSKCEDVGAASTENTQIRVLCFVTGAEEFPTVVSLRASGFDVSVASEAELPYTEQRVIWILQQLKADPPDVFVINAVYPAAYYAAPYLKEAGIAVVAVCHVHNRHPLYEGLMELIR